ncbi:MULTISPECIES: cobalt-precorrin-5B (C(1))-methyltransferase CbiD [unclassified Clostridium]|uniref:cobalt-precorrin-5B (C(1))-methyltransferase CbiD n=1 Tax=unclassified Clostridium TaxID=2614128 RepID=UPI001C8C53A2|nr:MULTISPECIES: cobalt-precorrin-5B (C(1))-methyltransferase CbiD [unclassified Clostridium]MBX9138576.1 cobalamin biosynthesis protein CbiD [Clostridium sp. K12(2020)]MBX9145352.1 cobalamin biosynthesis protein CbiD [Clostridium sp. K13]MDU4327262.1 cobalt-precorrin-5B (C(1))-methyltransferase CbiD [Clostridium celatum]
MLDLYVMSDGKKLRCGYTTGSCATAAAKAATIMLFNDVKLQDVEIMTPKGVKITIPINSVEKCKDYCIVSVIKDGGDDPDITDGIEIYAKVEIIKGKNKEADFLLVGGEGIGVVTKDGLFIEKGLHAINPTPRRTIEQAVKENLPFRYMEKAQIKKKCPIKVTISAPQGREIAERTFNPRLGIVGGISILGTSGIVKPMSEEALKESIRIEIRQKGKGKERLVLTFGNIGEKCAKDQGFNEDEIVIISNFVGFALECCLEIKIKEVILVGHIGKVSKVAYGCFNTHSRVNDVRLEVIALELALLGYDTNLIKTILQQKTSEGAVKFLGKGYEELYKNIGNKIIERLNIYTYGQMKCNVIMYYGFSDYNILYNSLEGEK